MNEWLHGRKISAFLANALARVHLGGEKKKKSNWNYSKWLQNCWQLWNVLENKLSRLNHQRWSSRFIISFSQRSAGMQKTNSLKTNFKPSYVTTTASASHDVRDLHKGRLLFFPPLSWQQQFRCLHPRGNQFEGRVQPTSGCASQTAEDTTGFHGKAALETEGIFGG